MEKFTLYSKSVRSSRLKTIKSSDDYTQLYDKGMVELAKDVKRERDFLIVEHGVRAIKLNACTIL